MAQAKTDVQRIRKEQAEAAIDAAYELREEYGAFLTRRKANREELRNLSAQGYLSAEQEAELEELYPKRQSSEQEAEEQAAA